MYSSFRMQDSKRMKVAIVHDWLNGMRGGEKVLESLLELYPEATIYTLFFEPVKVSKTIAGRRIVTSWLQRVPGIFQHYRHFLPFFPRAVESFDLTGFDLVISSSHAVAKAARAAPGALHVCYCHTPMRYVWDPSSYAMRGHQRAALRTVSPRLKRWDRESSVGVDFFIANSEFVRGRIRQYYDRDATVIYPPVDVRFFTPSAETAREDFYLAAGALVPYKRFDLVLEAFARLGRRLVVAGSGPELKRLKGLAGANVEFTGWVSASELRRLFRSARAFVFAGREDFGIMPVEARACGCPVIALAEGGVPESVEDGISGILFATQDAQAIGEAVRRFENVKWPVEQVRSQVERFGSERFKREVHDFIRERTSGGSRGGTA
jgi:glycosyltransferase involved in cell wall biosynthesis